MSEGYVYFLHDPITQTVKIGASSDPDKRLGSLQTSAPQELFPLLVVRVEDMFAVERSLHEKFAHLRVRGEWFTSGGEILQFIAAGALPGSLDPPQPTTLPSFVRENKPVKSSVPSGKFKLKHLEKKSGVKGRTIRYYISIGLLPGAEKMGRDSYYTTDHLERLENIQALKEKGYSLLQIEELFQPRVDPGLVKAGWVVLYWDGEIQITVQKNAPPKTIRAVLEVLEELFRANNEEE